MSTLLYSYYVDYQSAVATTSGVTESTRRFYPATSDLPPSHEQLAITGVKWPLKMVFSLSKDSRASPADSVIDDPGQAVQGRRAGACLCAYIHESERSICAEQASTLFLTIVLYLLIRQPRHLSTPALRVSRTAAPAVDDWFRIKKIDLFSYFFFNFFF